MDPKKPSAEVDEQRKHRRVTLETSVKITFDDASREGLTENISEAGILCLTDQAPRVTVEFDDGNGPRVYSGRLVRANRMGTDRFGLAIEFDPGTTPGT